MLLHRLKILILRATLAQPKHEHSEHSEPWALCIRCHDVDLQCAAAFLPERRSSDWSYKTRQSDFQWAVVTRRHLMRNQHVQLSKPSSSKERGRAALSSKPKALRHLDHSPVESCPVGHVTLLSAPQLHGREKSHTLLQKCGYWSGHIHLLLDHQVCTAYWHSLPLPPSVQQALKRPVVGQEEKWLGQHVCKGTRRISWIPAFGIIWYHLTIFDRPIPADAAMLWSLGWSQTSSRPSQPRGSFRQRTNFDPFGAGRSMCWCYWACWEGWVWIRHSPKASWP